MCAYLTSERLSPSNQPPWHSDVEHAVMSTYFTFGARRRKIFPDYNGTVNSVAVT